MKQNVTLEAPIIKVNVDCFACDHQKDEYVILKKGFLGIGRKVGVKYWCDALGIRLSSDLLNLWDMTKEQCPCHFEKWIQTNAELEEFAEIPTYVFTLKDGKVIFQLG